MKNNDNITKDVESISYDEALNANQEIGNLIAKLQKAQADNRSFVEQIRGFKMIEKVECPYAKKSFQAQKAT